MSSHLLRRGGTFYFRLRVPQDLLDLYSPAKEIKRSLKTTDYAEAKTLALREAVRQTAEFDSRRRLSSGGARSKSLAPGLVELPTLDDAFIEWICNSWLRDALEADVRIRADEKISDIDRELRGERAAEQREIWAGALASGNIKLVEEVLALHMRHLGFELRLDDESYRRLAFRFLQTIVGQIELICRRDSGNVVVTEEIVSAEKAGADRFSAQNSMKTLLEDWEQMHDGRPPKTIREYHAVATEFSNFVGKINPRFFTKQHFIDYKNHLSKDRRQHRKTINKKLGVLSTLMRLGVDNGRIPSMPYARIMVPKPKVEKKARLPFTGEHMRAIFSCPIYSQNDRPAGGCGEAAFWMPLIGAFSGARIEEIAQLQLAHVVYDEEHGWHFVITDEGEGSVKTNSSRRRVPVHVQLIEAGFLVYLEWIKSKQHQYLFPDIKADRDGKRSSYIGKWFGRYLRSKIRVTDPLRTFHSFRHSFKDACREAGIGEELHDVLTGHVGPGSEGRGYGNELYPLGPLVSAMTKIRYRDVRVTHLRWVEPQKT